MNSHSPINYLVLSVVLLCIGAVVEPLRAQESPAPAPARGMSQAQLEALVREMADTARGGGGVLQFEYDGVILLCVSDVANDRMRILAPIGDYDGITPQQKDLMLVANFHTALDARYAVSRGVLYAAFIHPLSTLDAGEVGSAVRQVATLMQTFGGDYSSGALNFQGQAPTRKPSGKTPL
ncbi:YbjN domain-containing protein [Exilibacterium tricleocarpae]|uniref:YbjN domain-containing protein n=1 Tax=Exilibacterium tricleocarpae TaxID=2591008 RepID=A0A545T1Q4_9GAMM|nr:YbjN domain-containing protein [Exilibacterium tricleocarpae]TQV71146.1 YbjN domain-containing protein [Exilibacterium tricleocarpae]